MRLIDVETFSLSEFFGSQIPGYAILSHTRAPYFQGTEGFNCLARPDSISGKAGQECRARRCRAGRPGGRSARRRRPERHEVHCCAHGFKEGLVSTCPFSGTVFFVIREVASDVTDSD
ncbi:hypothetical protein B0T16DRAFT_403236 [Cercophora newfieldiana]|uniref:Uncharacterized protein n=1 Tax=Cercophora newfieldiana TaxID=92897 RepID=A0AA39YEG2_9PEZI|nr:hypothetical protein B0T16DRAFT_403236 [Cercophora newfieldiana]